MYIYVAALTPPPPHQEDSLQPRPYHYLTATRLKTTVKRRRGKCQNRIPNLRTTSQQSGAQPMSHDTSRICSLFIILKNYFFTSAAIIFIFFFCRSSETSPRQGPYLHKLRPTQELTLQNMAQVWTRDWQTTVRWATNILQRGFLRIIDRFLWHSSYLKGHPFPKLPQERQLERTNSKVRENDFATKVDNQLNSRVQSLLKFCCEIEKDSENIFEKKNALFWYFDKKAFFLRVF
jgi:hypothetical protein